jgi:hypothetical protein
MKQKQHYLSRYYLAYFIDPADGRSLYVYEKGGKPIRKSRPENEAFRKDYYATISADGILDSSTIEQEMARVEGLWKPALDRILAHMPLEPNDRTFLAGFIGLTAMRSPSFHESMQKSLAGRYQNDWHRDRPLLLSKGEEAEEVAAKWRRRFKCSVEEFQAMLKTEAVKLGFPLENCLLALNWSNAVADPLAEMKWSFLVAPQDQYFVTSDTPVHVKYADPEKVIKEQGVNIAEVQTFPDLLCVSMRHPQTDLTFPLSPQLALYAGWGCPEGYIGASAKDVSEINDRTIIMADRWVYASIKCEALDQEVQSHTGSRAKLLGG